MALSSSSSSSSSSASASAAAEAPPRAPSAIAPLAGVRVLLVDADADTLEMTAAIFTEQGARTRATLSEDEALQALDSVHPDVVVADLGADVERRYAFIHAVRARRPDVFAVAVTAYTSDRDRVRALAEGFDAHRAKPLDVDEVLQLVKSRVARAPVSEGRASAGPADRRAKVLADARASSQAASATVIQISEFLARSRERTTTLRQEASTLPPEEALPTLLVQTLEELGAHEEELRVVDEQQRHAQLAHAEALAGAEQRIRRFQRHLDRLPDGFAVTDRRGMVLEVNETLATMLNVEPRFLVGKPLVGFVARADCGAFLDALDALGAKPRADGIRLRLRPRRGGAVFHAELNARTDERDKVVRWAVRDVAERVEELCGLARRLREAEEALAKT